jgi:hypothetical protein
MSHFVVMVAGEDIDHELAPFHQFECTGNDNEFVVPVDETEEALADYNRRKADGKLDKVEQADGDTIVMVDEDFITWASDYYGREIVEVGQEPDIAEKHKYGFIQKFADGTFKLVNRTNPNDKWDWYQEGGRWSGYFTLKDGTTADSCLKSDIDFEGIEAVARAEAEARFDKAHAAIAGRTWLTWEENMKRYPGNHDAARESFWSQPAVAALKEAFSNEWMLEVESFRCEREVFVNRAVKSGLVSFAFLQNRKWAERGEMGWFGTSTDKMTRDEWNDAFWSWLDALPDDTILTAVDCHI